jgi:hypothetical protein
MANVLYSAGKEAFLSAEINLSSAANNIAIVLIDTNDYSFSDSHTVLNDVTGAARVATATLGSKTVTSGVFDAADATFSNVTGDVSEALIIYHDVKVAGTTDANNSTLIAYIDTATGLPITPGGGDITVAFSDGANKIFAL